MPVEKGRFRANDAREPRLLKEPGVAAKVPAIRHRLLPILVLLGRDVGAHARRARHLLDTTTKHRVERGREGVTEEVARIAKRPSDVVEPYQTYIVGMRGGVWRDERASASAPEAWRATIAEAMKASEGSRTIEYAQATFGDSTLIVAAQPARRRGWRGRA